MYLQTKMNFLGQVINAIKGELQHTDRQIQLKTCTASQLGLNLKISFPYNGEYFSARLLRPANELLGFFLRLLYRLDMFVMFYLNDLIYVVYNGVFLHTVETEGLQSTHHRSKLCTGRPATHDTVRKQTIDSTRLTEAHARVCRE